MRVRPLSGAGFVPLACTLMILAFPSQSPADFGLLGGITEGRVVDVALSGDYAYVAASTGLWVVDVSSPEEPVRLRTLPLEDEVTSVHISGDLAFVTGFTWFKIFDIESPTEPVLISTTPTPGHPQDVEVSGSYAYVAARESGLRIFDITSLLSPAEVGSYDPTGWIYALAVSGDYVYMTGEDYFWIIDVSNPASPVQTSAISLPGRYASNEDGRGTNLPGLSRQGEERWGTDICISGEWAYMTTNYSYYGGSPGDNYEGHRLFIVSVSNPAEPLEGARLPMDDFVESVEVAGDYAYVGLRGALQVVDISTPGAPLKKGMVEVHSNTSAVVARDQYVYAAAGEGGFLAVDVVDPDSPRVASTIPTVAEAVEVYADGGYAYLGGRWHLYVVELGDGRSPEVVGTLPAQSELNEVFVSGDYLYAVDVAGSLLVIDISNPTLPSHVTSFALERPGSGIHVSGQYAYVSLEATNAGRLAVIDVSTPGSPEFVTSVETAGDADGLFVLGDYAYIADGWELGISIMYIGDPATPVLTGSHPAGGASQAVCVQGDYAYLATWHYATDRGFSVVDVSDPYAPERVAIAGTPYYSVGVYVSGTRAYVTSLYEGVRQFDISVPGSPVILGDFDMRSPQPSVTDPSARSVHGGSGLVCVASQGSGLWVLSEVLSISGYVRDASGFPLKDVLVRASGDREVETYTWLDGHYEINGLEVGSYSLTASKVGWEMTPAYIDIPNLTESLSDQDFVATMQVYTISGHIRDADLYGIENVVVSLSGDSTLHDTTGVDGYYQFEITMGDYEVTPALAGWGFEPPARAYTYLVEDKTDQDFTGTYGLFGISGVIEDSSHMGLPGVLVDLTGAAEMEDTTDSEGRYAFSALMAGDYEVRPTFGGWSFEPPARIFTDLNQDQVNQDFVGAQVEFAISGNVLTSIGSPVEGVAMALTGAAELEDITDSLGYYEFTGLAAGVYSVEPSKAGMEFSPAVRHYEPLNRDQTRNDYVGRALRGTIRVVGGENGYVDPDRGESATIIVTPRLTGYISLTVYTLRGEIVFADRVYVEQDIENTFEWGCKNDGGKLVSPGVYVFRFEGAGINETKKIAVVR